MKNKTFSYPSGVLYLIFPTTLDVVTSPHIDLILLRACSDIPLCVYLNLPRRFVDAHLGCF